MNSLMRRIHTYPVIVRAGEELSGVGTLAVALVEEAYSTPNR